MRYGSFSKMTLAKMCLGEEWEWKKPLKKTLFHTSSMSGCISHHRSTRITPLDSLCLNIRFIIASFASAGCTCIIHYGGIIMRQLVVQQC